MRTTDEKMCLMPTRALALVGFFFLLGSGFARAGALDNPSFEQPLDPAFDVEWDARGPVSLVRTTAPVYAGSYALLVANRTNATWNGLRQNVTGRLVPGTEYQLSAWVRMATGTADTVIGQMVYQWAGGTSTFLTVASAAATDQAYVPLTGTFTFNAPLATNVLVVFHGPAIGRDFLIDATDLAPAGGGSAGTSVPAADLVFRASGSAVGSNWLLQTAGFIGTFIENTSTATRTAILRVPVRQDTAHTAAETPSLRIAFGRSAFSAPVSTGWTDVVRTLDVPPGLHLLNLALANPAIDESVRMHVGTLMLDGDVQFRNEVTSNLVMRAAQDYIEHFRRRPFSAPVSDELGQPLAEGSVVTARLVRHSFYFGTAVYGWGPGYQPADWAIPAHSNYAARAPYRAFLTNSFNGLVPANAGKWAAQESVRGAPNLETMLAIQAFAVSNGMQMRMHNVTWGSTNGGHPPWVQSLVTNALAGNTAARDELRAELTRRIAYYVSSNAAPWSDLEVVNESMHQSAYLDIFGESGLAALHQEALDVLDSFGNNTRLYLNEYNALRGYTQFGDSSGYANWYLQHVFRIRNHLATNARERLSIGIQAYQLKDPGGPAHFDPVRTYRVLQNLGSLGQSLAISEFGISSNNAPTEAECIGWLRDNLLLALGTPGVESFNVWGFWRPFMWSQANAAPMLNDDFSVTDFGRAWQHMTGRAAHPDLGDLPWFMTETTVVVSAGGVVEFRGFPGDYEFSLPGGARRLISIRPDERAPVRLALEGVPPRVTFTSHVGRAYSVQAASSLLQGDWTTAVQTGGTGVALSVPIQGESWHKVYRVVHQPEDP